MKVLGIDYGRKKVGVALGDSEIQMAEPLAVWSKPEVSPKILDLIPKNKIGKIIIGLPSGRLDNEIKEFGQKLQRQTGLPVEFFDETLTTQDAQKLLIKSQKKRKFRQEMEDAYAAALMLESYLEGGVE
jgi:putative Holliday junction resolvase